MTNDTHIEHWFQVEGSPTDANDWNKISNQTFGTPKLAHDALRRYRKAMAQGWEYRIVRITHIEEVWHEVSKV